MPPREDKTVQAQNLLVSRLHALEPTGTRGFEGLLASCLSELTGQAFHVAKSGHQEGTDVRSAPHNLFKVGLEGKRYSSSTSLSTAELLSKITDASRSNVPVDLWILAVTRSIDISTREKLHEHGADCGIGVIVLDWPEGSRQLTDLAVILASAPESCDRLLGCAEELTAAFEVIRLNSLFEGIRSRILEQLTRGDVGYDGSRRATDRWLVKAQTSLSNAKSRLGGHHNLREAEFGVIPRTAINRKLDEWYTEKHTIAALLGDEGTGKSWATLDWYSHLKSSETGAPLTVFIPATAVDGRDVRSTIAKALATQTRIPSVHFWEKRLTLWERSVGDGVRILILVDGLNENFHFTDWTAWCQPLFEDGLGVIYRVLVSCWPHWWRESLSELADLAPKPYEIHVDGFNDAEIDALLASMDVQRADFPREVLDLMRVPRLSSLVLRHRHTLTASGDVTAERVIYEDWKDRLARRGSRTGLTDLEMKSFVTDLGEKLRSDIDQAMTRKDILKVLSRESGKSSLELQPAIAELSSGAWLISGDRPNTFKVAAGRIPFVLGATLVSHLRNETSVSILEAKIADFLDPLKAHSLGAAILRATTTIALVESETSSVCREVVLSRWLEERNFRANDFEAFWRLAGIDPGLFLDLAEAHWLALKGDFVHDEVLIKAFANAATFDAFRTLLTNRLTRWLSTAWPDPKVGAVLGRVDRSSKSSSQRSRETGGRHKRWLSTPTRNLFPSIQLDDNDGWSWLSPRALAILSYGKRQSFGCVIAGWALSRSIMGCARHKDEMAWLLRLNREDHQEAAEMVFRTTHLLRTQNDSVCDRAATYLDAALSHVGRWSEPLVIPDDSRAPVTPVQSDTMDGEALFKAAREFLSPNSWKEFDPASVGRLITNLIERGLNRNLPLARLLAKNIPGLLILLSRGNRKRLRLSFEDQLRRMRDGSDANKDLELQFHGAAFLLDLYDAEPNVQSNLILSNVNAEAVNEWLVLCRAVTTDDVASVEFDGTSSGCLARWFDYLSERLPRSDIAELTFLCDFVIHEDSLVRKNALALAAFGRNLPALKMFATSRFADPPSEKDKANREDEYWRNRGLLELCEYSPDERTGGRLSPECAALIAENKPNDPNVLRDFNRYLRRQFEELKTAPSWSSPHYWKSYRKGIEALVKYDLESLLTWLIPWLADPIRVRQRALMDSFPVIDTMQALTQASPKVAIRIYEILVNPCEKGIVTSDGVVRFPLELPCTGQSTEICDSLLAEAKTDRELFEIACAAHRNARVEWLLQWIERLEASSIPAEVAKAYTLLGCCDEGAGAETLWRNMLTRPPSDGWLSTVFLSSARDYARNLTARRELAEFWDTQDVSVAWRSLKVVEEHCDLRITLWIERVEPERKDWTRKRSYARSLVATQLNQVIRRDRERRKKMLFHTPLAYSTMAPWK